MPDHIHCQPASGAIVCGPYGPLAAADLAEIEKYREFLHRVGDGEDQDAVYADIYSEESNA